MAFLLLRCSKRQRHGNSYNYASTDEADKFCQGGEEIRAEEEWVARDAKNIVAGSLDLDFRCPIFARKLNLQIVGGFLTIVDSMGLAPLWQAMLL